MWHLDPPVFFSGTRLLLRHLSPAHTGAEVTEVTLHMWAFALLAKEQSGVHSTFWLSPQVSQSYTELNHTGQCQLPALLFKTVKGVFTLSFDWHSYEYVELYEPHCQPPVYCVTRLQLGIKLPLVPLGEPRGAAKFQPM